MFDMQKSLEAIAQQNQTKNSYKAKNYFHLLMRGVGFFLKQDHFFFTDELIDL